MTLAPDAAYRVLQAHDARFDGRLFVGVTSTRVYCRPVCRVRLPRRENCRFFGNAASAERDGFRPCLRCRPELAPGLSLVDSPTGAGAACGAHDRAAPRTTATMSHCRRSPPGSASPTATCGASSWPRMA